MFIQKRFLMIVFLLVSSFIFWSITSPCIAQEKFPSRSITLLIGYPPGGAGDLLLRYLSESVSKRLGQPVVILNKIGGEGQSRSAKSKPRNLMAIRLGICRVAQL
jgi:tripartite-type tricarboxylate transporter receptor subunit TctC